MVSYNLRQHVLAAYNHLWYKDPDITGSESQEILVEDWLSLSNAEVQAILVEAARPRTREMCARELFWVKTFLSLRQQILITFLSFSTIPWSNFSPIGNNYVLYFRPIHLPTVTSYLKYLFQDMEPKIVLAKSKSAPFLLDHKKILS